jgi:hypothetical protein
MQGRVADEYVDRLGGLPAVEVGQHEVDGWDLLGGELDHRRAAVDADDVRVGPTLGQQLGEGSGA